MDMETNKLLAALLVAGIVAMLAGFIAHKLIAPKELTEHAYRIEGVESVAVPGGTPAPAEAEPIEGLMASADPAHGEKVSKVCASCHTFSRGEPNRIGPNLAGIVGAAKATVSGFAYSDALKSKGGAWNVESLNSFLWNPKKFAPGTKMTFAGLKKPEDRAALIKWMETHK
jgi:cytochrome c